MKHSEAVRGLYTLMSSIQKCRSNTLESMEIKGLETTDVDSVLSYIHPWLFGPKNLLIGVQRLIERIESGGQMEPLEWFNLRYVAWRMEPAISVVWGFRDHAARNYNPDKYGIEPWDEEES